MTTMFWKGKQQSTSVIVMDLWEQYIGAWDSQRDYLQTCLMLQESIRRTMRAEYDSYLRGKATEGRVKETKGHAVLLGKIVKEERQFRESLETGLGGAL